MRIGNVGFFSPLESNITVCKKTFRIFPQKCTIKTQKNPKNPKWGFHGNVGFCRFFSGLKPPVLIYLLQEGTLTLTHENLQRKTIKRIGQLLIHSILNNCRPIKILYLDRLFESFVQLEHWFILLNYLYTLFNCRMLELEEEEENPKNNILCVLTLCCSK